MRYIGSKQPVLGFLEENIVATVGDVKKKVFADLFAGTCVVSILFKKLGSKIIANDYMTYSYVMGNAYLKVNEEPKFLGLKASGISGYLDALKYLNNIRKQKGFFYRNYSPEGTSESQYVRNYFSGENTQRIDAIISKLKNWRKDKIINAYEEHVLKTSLLEAVTKISNISGTYGAFLKKDDKRKFKRMLLKPIEIISSRERHYCYNEDALKIINQLSGDILYLDPPYNQRQYPPYYHILETVVLGDAPLIYGKTGRRPYKDKLSPFCNKRQAYGALDTLISKARFKHIFLSYNNEGIISIADLDNMLSHYGDVKVFKQNHRRFKSNNNGKSKQSLREILFYVKKKN